LTDSVPTSSAVSVGAFLARPTIDRREVQMLLAHTLGTTRAGIIAHPERLLQAAEAQLALTLITRRAAGEPIAYLIGTREFYGRDFIVSPATLIPRPETELLVEQTLARLSAAFAVEKPANAGSAQTLTNHQASVLDLGTGSGAIAVSIALEYPDARVVAVDKSPAALSIATENARRLGATVEFIESDWYTNLTARKFDLIVANPPYVAGADEHLSQGDLRFEPQTALTDHSADGLDSIRTILSGARAHLNASGWLLVEHGYDQADRCRELLLKAGFESLISVADLAGIPRVAGGQIR
jgi:release factor glutamine methyltransferase